MNRESTVWSVAVLVLVLATCGAIISRMGLESGDRRSKGAGPAGLDSTGGGHVSRPARYAPIAPAIANTADAILEPRTVPTGFPAELGRPESPIGERAADRLRRRAMRQRFTPAVDAGDSMASIFAPPGIAISAYQDGPDADDNLGILAPPDPEIAAGPDHLVATVNTVFGFHDKVGGPPTFFDANTFFSADPNCPLGVFDPDVVYDEDAERFVMGYDALGTHYCVAFSDDSDPFGTWFLYAFVTAGADEFFDYPHIGVGPECIGLGALILDRPVTMTLRSDVWCMEKADGYAGAPLTVVMGTTGASSTPQPANLHGSDLTTTGPEHYILTDDAFDGQTFGVFSWDALGAGGDPVMISAQAWTPGGGGFPIDTPQSGAENLQANDWRIQAHPEQRDGRIWPLATVSANPSGLQVVNCFQWAEYDVATDSVIQGGLTCPGTNSNPRRNAIFAGGAANACGDFFVGFTQSHANMDPAIAVCGRRGDTALNRMSCTRGVKRGDIPYSSFDGDPLRWGDYTGMVPDPNGKDFWYFGEYSKDVSGIVKWGTHIGSIVTDCAG